MIRALSKMSWAATAAIVSLAALGTGGCNTEAYCFDDCAGQSAGQNTGAGGGLGGGWNGTGASGVGGDIIIGSATTSGGDGGDGGPCELSNGGIETCDAKDNDCNGLVDDLPGLDLNATKSCGTCDNNCNVKLTNCKLAAVECVPSANPGKETGECKCNGCAEGFFDLNGDGTCEYSCSQVAADDTVCNNKDDDCDGVKDEDADLCTSTTDCGKCGGNCVVLHGTPKCVHTGSDACSPANTQCAIQACDCNGPGDCWHDQDGLASTGCEYKCDPTNNGVEICGDGVDNDCDGKIDGADDLSGDPAIGNVCYGDPDGECATAVHAGVTSCVGNAVVCAGPNVINEGTAGLEMCNGKDDDCDGTVDDNPTNAGQSCGQSNLAPCTFGKEVCQGGTLTCVGAINPQPEVCDGIDNNCDGSIDLTGNTPPADAVGMCDVPPAAPPGATTPCKAGTKACVGGTITCQGSVKPQPGATDTCGADVNCDGQLTNQPNLASDVSNCGACGNDCYAGAVHSIWSCNAGTCKFEGCESGYYDEAGNDQKCEYACLYISDQEACNGVDDNCNGQIDEAVANIPSPVQVCGVSPSAATPECTSQVTVSCQNGGWSCAFPAGVCKPSCSGPGCCSGTAEVCDALDNDCDGAMNENVLQYGQPCASDDASPVPGHGACRTTGVHVCNGLNATTCNAVKADCSSLAGGCTELCDGVDNDCDGSVDETFNSKGANTTYFVKPAVTKLNASTWIYSYEASRPTATSTEPGRGNGYYDSCANPNDPPCNGYSAPAGETRDKTPACSATNKIPWFNVSPIEVAQTCKAMGGSVCSVATWQTACKATLGCSWGYAPRGAACTSSFSAGAKFCNIGSTFDFSAAPGDQDGLLPTASMLLQNCFADWSNLPAGSPNPASAAKIFDITGNLREVASTVAMVNGQPKTVFPLMGGSFVTLTEEGATCDFSFFNVDEKFKFFDTGFRCCFSTDPTL